VGPIDRPASKFRRLAFTHAAMMGGEASMVVALADSFFFDVDPGAARGKVLLFLVISFAPFLLVAPLIGPVIDRIRGGRRFVVQAVAAARIVLQLLMMRFADELALFPLVFAALVLQKTYAVSKSALVPSVVRTERELVEANSKLGLIAGVSGVVAVLPAALLQVGIGSAATLGYGALLFVVALVAATRLPRDVVAAGPASQRQRIELSSSGLQLAAVAMLLLRCCVGFVLFHLAFSFRTQGAPTWWFGLAVGLSSLGTMAGNAIGPRLRSSLREDNMIVVALVLPTVAGIVGAIVGGKLAGIALAVVVNFGAALGRLAFESIVQREAPSANHGQAFARFETRFQFGWVIAATVPVVIEIPGALGYLLVGLMTAVALVNYSAGARGRLRRLPIRGQHVIRRRSGIAASGRARRPRRQPINRR
jgi:hypothetical protein